MEQEIRLQLVGASEIDLLELEETLPPNVVRKQVTQRGEAGRHHDLGATVAIITLSAAAIHAIALWLAKKRIEDETIITEAFERLPDGTIRFDASTVIRGSRSEPPSAAVMQSMKTDLTAAFAKLGVVIPGESPANP